MASIGLATPASSTKSSSPQPVGLLGEGTLFQGCALGRWRCTVVLRRVVLLLLRSCTLPSGAVFGREGRLPDAPHRLCVARQTGGGLIQFSLVDSVAIMAGRDMKVGSIGSIGTYGVSQRRNQHRVERHRERMCGNLQDGPGRVLYLQHTPYS